MATEVQTNFVSSHNNSTVVVEFRDKIVRSRTRNEISIERYKETQLFGYEVLQHQH